MGNPLPPNMAMKPAPAGLVTGAAYRRSLGANTGMSIRITTSLGDYGALSEGIREAVAAAIQEHPMLIPPVVLSTDLHIHVTLRTANCTETRHAGDQRRGSLDIYLFENDAFENETRRPPFVTVKYGKLRSDLANVFRHEFGHFIDARLNPEFQYSDVFRPTEPVHRKIHHSIWCAFIDARLGGLAPHTLEDRQEDASQFGVPPKVITAAWHGEFADYPTIVDVAARLATGQPKSKLNGA